MDYAFKYLESTPLLTEKEYPYLARRTILPWDKKCEEAETKATTKVTTYKDVTPKSESQMKAALAKQPVSIAIEADKSVF